MVENLNRVPCRGFDCYFRHPHSHYYRPAQLRTQIQAELFRATYDNRIESYQAIVQMFSDVYWLEREPTKDKEQRRTEVLQRTQREIIRSSPIVDRKVFELAFEAFNNYIAQSANFKPELRTNGSMITITSPRWSTQFEGTFAKMKSPKA